MPSFVCHTHNLHLLRARHLTKASWEMSAQYLNDFWSKGGKSAKSAQTMPNHAN